MVRSPLPEMVYAEPREKDPDSPSMEKEEMARAPSPVGFGEALSRRLPLRVVSSLVETDSLESVKVSSTALTVMETVSVFEEKADVPPYVVVSTLVPAEPDV